jgi:hypothetical protein
MPDRSKPFGLSFGKPVAVQELQEGQIVVLDGYVVEAGPDPDDPDRVRVVVVRALAGLEEQRDQREVVLSIPGDMKLGTAQPFNMDLPAPPAPSRP